MNILMVPNFHGNLLPGQTALVSVALGVAYYAQEWKKMVTWCYFSLKATKKQKETLRISTLFWEILHIYNVDLYKPRWDSVPN